MKYWAMTAAGAVLFIVGLLLGVLHISAAWASILFIIGTVLLVMSLGKVGKPEYTAGDGEKGNKDVGTYQI
jgi:membrane protein implicated in regulation of membrane protease activity